MEFKDKVVMITGGTSGIGKAAAIAYADLGAHVIALTLDKQEVIDQALEEIGHEALALRCDVSHSEDVEKAVNTIVERYGKIDIAFNNAGIGLDGVRMPYESITEIDEKTWDKVIAVDMKGVFLCLKYELLQMQKQGYGAIVNTASIGGYKMAPGFAAYGPAKAGVIALTEMAALENAAHGIRVNAICPGPTGGTELTKNSFSSNPHEENALKEHVIPMKKLATTKEVVNAVLYLSSDLSSHTTGQKIFIDGGMHIA